MFSKGDIAGRAVEAAAFQGFQKELRELGFSGVNRE